MKSLLLSTFCLFSVISFSQDTSAYRDTIRYYDHASIGFGYQQQSFPNLNARIIKYFPKAIPTDVYSINYGGKSVFNRFLIQGDFGGGLGVNRQRGKGSTSVFFINLNIDAGVMLTPPGAVRVYPFAGLGIDVFSVSAKPQTDNINFDSVLSNPFVRASTEPIALNNAFFSWRGGLAIDFGNPKKGNRPYSFGLRAGYKASINNGRWRFEIDNQLTNSPKDRLEQWFASVVIYTATGKMKQRSNVK